MQEYQQENIISEKQLDYFSFQSEDNSTKIEKFNFFSKILFIEFLSFLLGGAIYFFCMTTFSFLPGVIDSFVPADGENLGRFIAFIIIGFIFGVLFSWLIGFLFAFLIKKTYLPSLPKKSFIIHLSIISIIFPFIVIGLIVLLIILRSL